MKVLDDSVRNEFSKNKWERGERYYKQGRVTIEDVQESYISTIHEDGYFVDAIVEGSYSDYITKLIVTGGKLHSAFCSCPDFQSHYYASRSEYCKHVAAAVMEFVEYAELNSLIKTNQSVKEMIAHYENRAILKNITQNAAKKIDIQVRIEVVGNACYATFLIGSNKMYVMQNLEQFCEAMEIGANLRYGKELEFIHDRDMFSEEGKRFVDFIQRQVNQRTFYAQMITMYGRGMSIDHKVLQINLSAMDELFELMQQLGGFITVINMETGRKKQEVLECKKEDPKTVIYLKPSVKEGEVEYITLDCRQVEYVNGAEYGYILEEKTLYQVSQEYKTAMAPFLEAVNSARNIKIAKEDIPAFYKQVLGAVKPFAVIEEEEKECIEELLPPEPEFALYFDAKEGIVTCSPQVQYGEERNYNLAADEMNRDEVRDMPKELGVFAAVHSFLECLDQENGLLWSDREDKIYELLEHGFSELMEYGDVCVSDTLKRMQVKKSPKISVGVSTKSNLLNLEISSDEVEFAEMEAILASYHLKKKYHRLKNGDFLKLEENSLATVNELMQGMHLSVEELSKGPVTVPAFRALYLDKVLQESEGVNYNRDRYFKGMLRNFKGIEDADFEVPACLNNVLRTYQKVGYQWLRTLEAYGFGGILADDMGLGKTLQVITVLLSAKSEGKEGTSLIICPASLVYNWEEECAHFAPELNVGIVAGSASMRKDMLEQYQTYDVLVTSYDLLKRDVAQYKDLSFLYQIIDEAQYIKNHTTLGAKAVKVITAKTRYALTGTPIENRLSELWSIFDYLMPGFLYKYEQFRKELETRITKNQEEEAITRLKKMIQPFILRRIKQDVLKELPDKLEKVVVTKLEDKQQQLYDAYVRKLKASLESGKEGEFEKNKLKILSELTRLRQICCDPRLCYEDYTGDSAKLLSCLELVQNAIENGHKILLFSQFTSMLALIKEKLQEKGITFYEITGATKKQSRMELVNAFNTDDTNIFLISLKAGGTGLNLTAADVVIHYDPWWNIAAQNQATDRAHRMGQKNVVTVLKMIAKGTIEEKIVEMQEQKRHLADQIISGEMNQLSGMTKEEFMELLSL